MNEFLVQLTSVSGIKRFVNSACVQDFDITIYSGRYIVDAKSIMAVFSLDLSKPLRVQVACCEADCEAFKNAVKEFIVTDTLDT